MNLTPPEQYKLCSNSACKKSENCLQQLCYRQVTKNDIGIYVLNPLLFPKENEECPYFKSDKEIKLAWGTKSILDEIPNKKASEIKRALLQKYGRTKYYQFYRSEKPLFPSDQQIFTKIFKKTESKQKSNTKDSQKPMTGATKITKVLPKETDYFSW